MCNYPKVTYASTAYGRIVNTGSMLYKTATKDSAYSGKYFELENTYFVDIIDEYDDSYKVSYNGIVGYANKDAIKRISGTPQNPFPNNIKLTVNKSCYMRSTPSQSDYGNSIMLVSANTQVSFVGKIQSVSIEDFGDNTWYYVKVENTYGYIFSGYFKSKVVISPNTEQIALIDNTNMPYNALSNTTIALTIAIMCVPALVIMFVMYYRPSVKHKQKTKLKYSDKV